MLDVERPVVHAELGTGVYAGMESALVADEASAVEEVQVDIGISFWQYAMSICRLLHRHNCLG